MTTVREQIIVAVKAKLETLAGVTIKRNPVSPVEPEDMPAIALRDGGQQRSDDAYGCDRYDMSLHLELWVKSDHDDQIGPDLNALYELAMSVLTTDPSLGGLIIGLTEDGLDDPVIDVSDGQIPFGGCLLKLTTAYLTKSNDITTPGP